MNDRLPHMTLYRILPHMTLYRILDVITQKIQETFYFNKIV